MLTAVESIPGVEPATAMTFARQYGAAYYDEWQRFLLTLREPAPGAPADPKVFCAADSPYMTAFARVHAATTEPFRVVPDTPGDGEGGKPSGGAVERVIPGLEPPPWVPGLGRVAGAKEAYTERIAPACTVDISSADPCADAVRLAGRGTAAPDQSMRQLRAWVQGDLVAVAQATDADDRRVREHVTKLLTVPVDRAEHWSAQRCAERVRQEFAGLGGLFPKPWSLQEVEGLFAPGARVDGICQEKMASFFDCTTVRQKPGTAVSVSGSVVGFMQGADRMKRAFFYPAGGWRTNTITFESVPTTSAGGARVTETALSIYCSDLPEQPWTLSHRQMRVKKAIGWQPDRCGEARLRVMLTGHDGLPRTAEIARPGPFGLVDLLNAATASGNEYSWHLPEGNVTAVFRVWLPDRTILDYNRLALPH
jgi:hypothetical protein